MSFQLYLQVFENKQPSGISLDSLRKAFAGMLFEIEEDHWQVHFGRDQSSDLFLQFLPNSSGLVHTISIDRPNHDERLWRGVFELLAQPGVILYYPGGKAPLVRNLHAYTSAPIDLMTSLGEPLIVSDAAAITAIIENAQT
jgi:hypothetical protein